MFECTTCFVSARQAKQRMVHAPLAGAIRVLADCSSDRSDHRRWDLERRTDDTDGPLHDVYDTSFSKCVFASFFVQSSVCTEYDYFALEKGAQKLNRRHRRCREGCL